jgi:hypothetical protein
MNSKTNEPNSGGGAAKSVSVRQMVLAAAAVTVAAAAVAAYYKDAPFVRRLLMQVRGDKPAPDLDASAMAVVQRLPSISETQFESEARGLVAANSPRTLQPILAALLASKDNSKARLFAVHVIEQGALRYKTVSYLNQAGFQFYAGANAPRDYAKAEAFLSDPVLAEAASSNYFLGMVLLAQDNPAGDSERGLALLKKSAESGYGPAKSELEKLM